MQDGICVELVQRVAQHGPALHRASAAAAEVDCLVALAQSARQFHLQRPKLTTDNVLSIHQGLLSLAARPTALFSWTHVLTC